MLPPENNKDKVLTHDDFNRARRLLARVSTKNKIKAAAFLM